MAELRLSIKMCHVEVPKPSSIHVLSFNVAYLKYHDRNNERNRQVLVGETVHTSLLRLDNDVIG